MKPTDLQVFRYAERFASRAEAAGRGTQWPTLQQAARRFRCRISDVEEAVEGSSLDGDHYFGIAVAVGISGVGYAPHDHRGECQIEAYGEVRS